MNEPADPIVVKLRIPGLWPHPKDLLASLPTGFRFTPDSLVFPDKTRIGFSILDADNQFAQIFRSSCRQPAETHELEIVDGYKVNVCLSGPGGSIPAALKMMEAGATLIRAGGAGVFIDNSALAHGGQNWIEMAEDGSPDALSFAFVSIVGGKTEAYTMGMHVLGLRDVVMGRPDAESDEFGIIDVVRYLARSEKPVADGHLFADLDGPRFQAIAQNRSNSPAGSPMHNPFGQWKLVSMRDVAERN